MSAKRSLAAAGAAIGLFVGVYIPTFAAVTAIRPSITAAVPLVLTVSLTIAFLLMATIVRLGTATGETFGFRLPSARVLVVSLAIAVPLAAVAWLTLKFFPEQGPFANVKFTGTQALLYFAVGAAIQEEVIFRGLIQSTALRVACRGETPTRTAARLSVVAAALLFGAIHLAVGPVTALFATVLGLLAGYARHASGSLLPAVLCHSVFNTPGVLMAFTK
jgi:sodium transport system permease protein